MSIDEINEYWNALVSGDAQRNQSLREKFRSESELNSIMDMLDELFDISLELGNQKNKKRAGPAMTPKSTGRGRVR